MQTTINIKHDGLLDIALGKHRRETAWRNKEMLWSDFVKKVSVTHRTAEAYSEYIKLKKARQDEIKDIGGYVGGLLSSGRRKKNNVAQRSMITLDLDFADTSVWEDLKMITHNAACMYTTHKHSPAAPRYRIIMPLDRPVFPDQYQAIARRLLSYLGVDDVDPTTFQAERLMYWPSTSRDGEYTFKYQDGPFMSADELLATYNDWTDTSEWPMWEREDKFVQYGIKKQGDPLEKTGMVGAYCRTYTIHEVIENELPDIYESCDIEGRYTYKAGSTAAGMVTYEDKWAYSHHGTDPVGGKLCNAFDLVRLHLYAALDEDVKEGTPGNRLPSYLAMSDRCAKDPKVRKQLGAERLESAKYDFDLSDITETDLDDPANDEWLSKMEVDSHTNYRSTIDNMMLVLKNDPALKNRMSFDLFEQREIALKNLPWRQVTPETYYLTDKDDAGVRHYMEKVYGMVGIQKTTDALNLALAASAFHPVRDYLNGLEWDGESRVETLLVDYLGADDTPYTREVTRKTLAAAVARVFRPGIKYDYVLVLVGKQGVGKSTLVSKLGKQWFSDSFTTIQGKESFEQIQGVWIVEIAELSGFKKSEVEAVKHYVGKGVDRYRVAYGRRTENFPRQCIFIGTTNNRNFLKDSTGDRRFWPVDVYENEPTLDVFNDFTDYEIGQVWAEAVEIYRSGEMLCLDKETEALAKEQQLQHSEHDERLGMIENYLDTLLPDNWEDLDVYGRRAYLQGDEISPKGKNVRNRVCAAEIWCEVLGGTTKDMTRYNTKEIHDMMRTIPGWYEAKTKTDFRLYGTQKVYRRLDEDKKLHKKLLLKNEFSG